MMRKGFYAGMLALALGVTTVFSGMTPLAASAQTTAGVEEAEEYTYCYAGLTWNEYWASEGVYAAGDDTGSTDLDSHSETDCGAFDAVTRATTNHGLHRGSYQSILTAYDTEGNGYGISYWKIVDNTAWAVLTEKTSFGADKVTLTTDKNTNITTMTFDDTAGTTKTFSKSIATGIKYVPVKVKTTDFEAFKAKYTVVENGGTLQGGYTEKNLKSYNDLVVNVTEKTNGLKTATINSDGSFSFSARATGTESGIADAALKTVDDANLTKTLKSGGSYGEFIRLDFTNAGETNEYGDLGANMQAVKWTYYGSDSTYTTPLQTYGTKFAADNWMHKSNGIQLGLTDSLRCQLPEGTDGTGYWTVTVYALGYADYTYKFQATADDITTDNTAGDTTELKALVEKVSAYQKSDYTEKSWSDFETELGEAKALLEKATPTKGEVEEAYSHLQAAIDALVKASDTTTTENKDTTSTTEQKKDTSSTTELKDSGITLSAPSLKVKKTTAKSAKLKWKKVANATGYEIQYTKKKNFNKASAVKTVKVSGKASAQIKKLKKKSKYKVRIRAIYEADGYKTVYSAWSKVKTAKTK